MHRIKQTSIFFVRLLNRINYTFLNFFFEKLKFNDSNITQECHTRNEYHTLVGDFKNADMTILYSIRNANKIISLFC